MSNNNRLLPNKLSYESLPTAATLSSSSLLPIKDMDIQPSVLTRSSPLPSVSSSLTTQSPTRKNKHLNRNNSQHIHINNTSIHSNIKPYQVTGEMVIKPAGTIWLSRNKSSSTQQTVTNHQSIAKSRKDDHHHHHQQQQLSKESIKSDVKNKLSKSRSTSPVKLKLRSSDSQHQQPSISVLKEKFLKVQVFNAIIIAIFIITTSSNISSSSEMKSEDREVFHP